MKYIVFTSTLAGLLFAAQADATNINNGVEFSGYLDSYYEFNFNRPSPVTLPNAASPSAAAIPNTNNFYHYYDNYHNQMTLSLVELTVKARKDDVHFLADLDFGTFADLSAWSSSSYGNTVDEVSKHIGQAVVSYRPASAPRFSIDAGKMYTHLGLETAKPKDNWNYSRSLLFSYGIPFWHTGAKVSYDIDPERFSTSIFIFNGWNSLYENNNSKTLGAQLKLTPHSNISVIYNFIGGPEQTRNERNWKVVHEINSVLALDSDFQLGLDFVLGSEENVTINNRVAKAQWYGGSIAARYQVAPKTYLSPRYELYRDQNGYTLGGGPQTVHSGTFTIGQELSRSLESRAEFRHDNSNANSFRSGATTLKRSQTSALVALLFQF